MQDRHLYEYAVIRLVPRVEREEFLNVGVILYCPQNKSLYIRQHLPVERIMFFAPLLDKEEVLLHLQAFERIVYGEASAGAIALLPVPERFRWLTATRSTILQCSKVHTGFCLSPEKEIERLFGLLVK